VRNEKAKAKSLSREAGGSRDQPKTKKEINEATALIEVVKLLNSTFDFTSILDELLAKAAEFFPNMDGGVLYLFNERDNTHRLVACYGYPKNLRGLKLDLEEGAPGLAYLKKEPFILFREEAKGKCYDTVISTNGKKSLENVLQLRPQMPKSIIGTPFIIGEKFIGSICLEQWQEDKEPFSENDLQLLVKLADLLAVVIENRLLWREVKEKEERNHQLLVKIISTQEEERRRVARELHDEISQIIMASIIRLRMAANEIPPDHPQLQKDLNQLIEDLNKTSLQIKNLIFTLRPTILDDLGLPSALDYHIHNCLPYAEQEIKLEITGCEQRMSSDIETVIFRIAQEALSNTVRYSKATKVRVLLSCNSNSVTLNVEDNGVGFSVKETLKDTKRSLGLHGMLERASLVNGKCRIVSSPGKGTKIEVTIPLAYETKEEAQTEINKKELN